MRCGGARPSPVLHKEYISDLPSIKVPALERIFPPQKPLEPAAYSLRMTSIAREIAKRIGKLMEEEAKEFIEELEKEIAEAFRPKSSTASIDSKIF